METIRKRLGAVVATGLLMVAVALPVQAADLVIELPFQVIRARPNTVTFLASEVVPSDLVGNRCTATAVEAGNNESVHPGNTLLVVSGGETAVLLDVERAAGVSTGPSNSITLSEGVGVYLDLGPDGVYSAELKVTLQCSPPETTTTSTTVQETTTTTIEQTTTTVPDTTSTTIGQTTTTAPETTSTTEPEQTTTTEPEGSSESTTTVPETTSSTGGATESTLPRTGLSAGSGGLLAAGAVAFGGLILALTRRAAEDA